MLKRLYLKLSGAWLVLTGRAVPVIVYEQDTSIIVIETEGSQVSYLSCKNIVDSEQSYNILISKIVLWACSKSRFFWTGDQLGSELRQAAEEHFEERKIKG